MEEIEYKFEDLLGKVLVGIENINNCQLIYTLDSGERYFSYNYDEEFSDIQIEDIDGDLNDLLNSPILIAEEVHSKENLKDCNDGDMDRCSSTWTFYKLATIKGYVTIRWYGTSNGYYAETVSFGKLN